MKTIVGYGHISNSRIRFKDFESHDVTKSNAYKRTKKLLKGVGCPNSNIYIDIVNSHYRKKPKLEKLIEKLKPGDVIVTLTISFLGEGEQLVKNYNKILKNNIGLLIVNKEQGFSKFSTVDLGFNSRVKDMNLTELIQELRLIKRDSYKQIRGRFEKEITPSFIKAYWLYEKFLIPEPVAYELSGVSKGTFHKLASEYEATKEYLLRLRDEDLKNNIRLKPKRYGKIPKGFVGVIALVDKGASLESACIQSSIQPINPIDYERYRLKYFGGRKALAKAVEY